MNGAPDGCWYLVERLPAFDERVVSASPLTSGKRELTVGAAKLDFEIVPGTMMVNFNLAVSLDPDYVVQLLFAGGRYLQEVARGAPIVRLLPPDSDTVALVVHSDRDRIARLQLEWLRTLPSVISFTGFKIVKTD
jgi:hypothetical protein